MSCGVVSLVALIIVVYPPLTEATRSDRKAGKIDFLLQVVNKPQNLHHVW
jgi:hypothetical protein